MKRAFSLLELVIVVMIITVIAAIAVPRATKASRNAQAASMAAHIRRLADAFDLYHAEHGAWPPDSLAGFLPVEMQHRLRTTDFARTPAGGKYDWQNWTNGHHPMGGCIMGIADGITDWNMIQRIDELIDDGNLLTGAFVRHNLNGPDSAGNMAGLRVLIE